jgi:hypothetical protein
MNITEETALYGKGPEPIKLGDKYWFINLDLNLSFCRVHEAVFRGYPFDKARIKDGNCFRTEIHATKTLSRIKEMFSSNIDNINS